MGSVNVEVNGIPATEHALNHFAGAPLRSRMEAGTREAAQMMKNAIESEAPVGDPATDPHSGRLRGEIVIRPTRLGGYSIGPHSSQPAENSKIHAVIAGRTSGIHGSTQPNPFVARAEAKTQASAVRAVEEAVLS